MWRLQVGQIWTYSEYERTQYLVARRREMTLGSVGFIFLVGVATSPYRTTALQLLNRSLQPTFMTSLGRFITAVWALILLCACPSTLAQNSTYVPEIQGPILKLTLNWGYDYAPDCVKRQPLVQVNGMWPPPTLVVKAGEKVTLELTNELIAVAFTVHLHGFDQVGTPWADGTGMISTCPIIPDTSSSVQVFKAPPIPGKTEEQWCFVYPIISALQQTWGRMSSSTALAFMVSNTHGAFDNKINHDLRRQEHTFTMATLLMPKVRSKDPRSRHVVVALGEKLPTQERFIADH